MGGRPKKPLALKKLQGTFRTDRDSPSADISANSAMLKPSKIAVPKSITNTAVKKAFKNHLQLLRFLGAEQSADSPLLEIAYRALGESLRILRELEATAPDDKSYAIMQKSFRSNFELFEKVARDFYLTPRARAQLKIDMLTVQEKSLGIKKDESVVEKLLKQKDS